MIKFSLLKAVELFTANDIKLNLKNDDGETPIVTLFKYIKLMRNPEDLYHMTIHLMDNGADPFIKDKDGKNVFDHASKKILCYVVTEYLKEIRNNSQNHSIQR